jgi:hypothetical protein
MIDRLAARSHDLRRDHAIALLGARMSIADVGRYRAVGRKRPRRA